MVIPSSLTNAVNFMRYCGKGKRRVWKSETEDGGLSWDQPEPIEDLPNPNSAIAGLRLSNGDILLAFNDSADYRDNMSIARSDDNGTTWRDLYSFEKVKKGAGGTRHKYSYPSLIQTRDGTIHLFYTWRRTKIKHVQFNQAWLEQKMRQQR
jgi:predicted neuraminidase